MALFREVGLVKDQFSRQGDRLKGELLQVAERRCLGHMRPCEARISKLEARLKEMDSYIANEAAAVERAAASAERAAARAAQQRARISTAGVPLDVATDDSFMPALQCWPTSDCRGSLEARCGVDVHTSSPVAADSDVTSDLLSSLPSVAADKSGSLSTETTCRHRVRLVSRAQPMDAASSSDGALGPSMPLASEEPAHRPNGPSAGSREPAAPEDFDDTSPGQLLGLGLAAVMEHGGSNSSASMPILPIKSEPSGADSGAGGDRDGKVPRAGADSGVGEGCAAYKDALVTRTAGNSGNSAEPRRSKRACSEPKRHRELMQVDSDKKAKSRPRRSQSEDRCQGHPSLQQRKHEEANVLSAEAVLPSHRASWGALSEASARSHSPDDVEVGADSLSEAPKCVHGPEEGGGPHGQSCWAQAAGAGLLLPDCSPEPPEFDNYLAAVALSRMTDVSQASLHSQDRMSI